MVARVRRYPRDIEAEKEITRFVNAHPGELDFYDVVTELPNHSDFT